MNERGEWPAAPKAGPPATFAAYKTNAQTPGMRTSAPRRPLFHGTGVALVTPFTPDLAVDYAGWRHLLDFCIDGGVDYLVINGTTGESPTTTVAEKTELLRTAVEYVAGRRAPGLRHRQQRYRGR